MRSIALVLAAFVAGCGSGSSTVGTASAPPTGGGGDGGVGTPTPGGGGTGMPGGGTGAGGSAGGRGGSGGGGTGGSGGGGASGGGGDGGTACPTTPTIVADPPSNPIAADMTFVYGFVQQSLVRWPVDGGASSVVADGIDTSRDNFLVANDTFLFWSVYGTVDPRTPDKIVRVAKTGGTPEVIRREAGVGRGLVVVGNTLVSHEDDSLYAMDVDGNHVRSLTSNASAWGWDADADDAWWASAGTLYFVPLAGGVAGSIAIGTNGDAAIAAGDRFVWAGDTTGITRVDKSSHAVVHQAFVSPSGGSMRMMALAASGDRVWFGASGITYNEHRFGHLDLDGSVTFVEQLDGAPFVVAGDSIYYHGLDSANGIEVKRLCR